jgi:hypothetical protein
MTQDQTTFAALTSQATKTWLETQVVADAKAAEKT